jgi:hypothetical protein
MESKKYKMDDEDINSIKKQYESQDLYSLFEEYFSLKQDLEFADVEDMGKEVVENSKTLKILTE